MHIAYYARKNIVKRVIGMPGDIIEIKNKRSILTVNYLKEGMNAMESHILLHLNLLSRL